MSMLSADRGDETAGWLFIHACRRALIPHVESLAAGQVRTWMPWQWCEQPMLARHVRVDVRWAGSFASGARIASGLRMFPGVHAEITAEPTASNLGMRYALVPELGLWGGHMSSTGATVVSEDQLESLLANEPADVQSQLARLLGRPWDEVLEPLRTAPGRMSATMLRVV